jgi:hypothetical protein
MSFGNYQLIKQGQHEIIYLRVIDMTSQGHKQKIIGFLFALIACSQVAAVTPNETANPQLDPAETETCQAGLRFGITTDKIPLACHAHLVAANPGDAERKEKWEYQNGVLIFTRGVLQAIRQSNK